MPTLSELRASIDDIDHQLVKLLAQRAALVHDIGEIKNSEEEIIDPERQHHVISTRRAWARQIGLDADLVESVYRLLLDYFVTQEREQLAKRQSKPKS
jgi:chorismate mutase